MLRLLWNRMSKEEKGFTLVELLVVIVILGVLAGIGIPTYRGFIDRSHEAATLAELQAVSMAIKYYFIEPEHDIESFDLSKLERYLGDMDDVVVDVGDGSEKKGKKYLVYILEDVSEDGYISATTSERNRKSAWIYIDESSRGKIEIKDPSEGT